MNWTRVTKKQRCPVCGKGDWCMISPGGNTVLCMRVSGGKKITMRDGSEGWVHDVSGGNSSPVIEVERNPTPIINCQQMMEEWWESDYSPRIYSLAAKLGVTYASLGRLQCAWAPLYNAFAFPMKDGTGGMVGIRLRSWEGKKWAVRGSHQGLFIPCGAVEEPTCVICEGPTDCAAALSLSFYAIGRPSCSGGIYQLVETIPRLGIRRAIVVSDNDDPGLRGADTLGEHLPVPFCILVLPTKDLRQFVNYGGDKQALENLTKSAVWEKRKT